MKTRYFFGLGIFVIIFFPLCHVVPAVPDKHKTEQSKDTLYTFQKNALPLLQANCTPCHFTGGKVWNRLPFENYKTVASLGKKLNTRLKLKTQKAIVNGWVDQGMKEKF